MSCGFERAVHQRVARADAVALLDVDVHATRDAVFTRLGVRVVGHDHDLALALDDAAYSRCHRSR